LDIKTYSIGGITERQFRFILY